MADPKDEKLLQCCVDQADEFLTFDHLGYAVGNIKEYLDSFLIPLFQPIEVGETFEDPAQLARIVLVKMRGGIQIELIEPTSVSSPVNRIVSQRRGGLYHLCYRTKSLRSAIERFKDKSCMLISGPTSAIAFEGRDVAFLLTPQGDVLELLQEL